MKKVRPRGRNDSHIFDFSQITSEIFIGSDLCKGRKCKIHKDEFSALGINVEINLAAERKEIPPDDINSYSWIPVVDGYAPSQKQLYTGTAIINQAVENKEKVYVHCKNGHGRSPTMVAAYLIRFKRRGVNEAIDYITKKRPEIHIEVIQREALEKFRKKWSK